MPGLFDHYRSFAPLPAAYFGLRVVRRPSPTVATVAGGGLIASGPTGRDRSPVPWAPPGLHLTGLEGAGEVQTPLGGPAPRPCWSASWCGSGTPSPARSPSTCCDAHLLRGNEIVETVPTYRGTGHAW